MEQFGKKKQGRKWEIIEVASKALVKAGKEQGVKVPCMVMVSDQLWPRVMRRLLVREAAKR